MTRRRCEVVGRQGGLQVHRTRTPSFITRVPSLLLSSPILPSRSPSHTFRFSSSSWRSDLANARPSFPSPSRPLVLLVNVSLAACAVVNISPRQVDRRGSNLLCYSLHTRPCSACVAVSTRKKPAGPERRALLRTGMLSRENCVYSSTSGRIAKEKGGKQETVYRGFIASTRGFRFPHL